MSQPSNGGIGLNKSVDANGLIWENFGVYNNWPTKLSGPNPQTFWFEFKVLYNGLLTALQLSAANASGVQTSTGPAPGTEGTDANGNVGYLSLVVEEEDTINSTIFTGTHIADIPSSPWGIPTYINMPMTGILGSPRVSTDKIYKATVTFYPYNQYSALEVFGGSATTGASYLWGCSSNLGDIGAHATISGNIMYPTIATVVSPDGGWSDFSNPQPCVNTQNGVPLSCGGNNLTTQWTRTCSNPSPGPGANNCDNWINPIMTDTSITIPQGAVTASTLNASTIRTDRGMVDPLTLGVDPTKVLQFTDAIQLPCYLPACSPQGGWDNSNLMWSKCAPTDYCDTHTGQPEMGVQTAIRTCTNPIPGQGAGYCTPDQYGMDLATQQCQIYNTDGTPKLCNQDGGYTDWSDWSECNADCGGGTKYRTRSCTNPAPSGEGLNCNGLGASIQSTPCNTQACGTASTTEKFTARVDASTYKLILIILFVLTIALYITHTTVVGKPTVNDFTFA
jgi:hypothetical protein